MKNKIKLLGIIALAMIIGFGMLSCEDGGKYEPPPAKTSDPVNTVDPIESLSPQERWTSGADGTKATITHSVADNGVCTITVGGETETLYGKAHASYSYTASAGKTYIYQFKAWTAAGSGERKLYFEGINQNITIDETPTTYTLYRDNIPNSGASNLTFQCANKIGTFYVKVLKASENKIGELTITNFSGNSEFNTYQYLSGNAYVYDGFNYNYYSFYGRNKIDWYSAADITGSSITLYVFYQYSSEADEVWMDTPFTGNVTIPKGYLTLSATKNTGGDNWVSRSYINKVPITFTNGNANINFGVQMERVLEIDEYGAGELTITNFSGTPGLTAYQHLSGSAFSYDGPNINSYNFEGKNNNISGSSITLYVFTQGQVGYGERIPFNGNVTFPKGALRLNANTDEEVGGGGGYHTSVEYINKVPIIFTNGNANIDFGSQMADRWDTGKLTITNFPSNQGTYHVSGNANVPLDYNADYYYFSTKNSADITGSFVTLYVFKEEDGQETSFKGNVTFPKGALRLYTYGEGGSTEYINTVPITLTNGSATINFNTQMADRYDTGTLTITNFPSNTGLTEQYVSGNANVPLDDYNYDRYNFQSKGNITGSSVTLYVFKNEDGEVPFKGNVTVPEGDLHLQVQGYTGNTWIFSNYRNKVPITLTNGSATINFGSQMELEE